MMNDAETLLTVRQVAAYLSCAEETVKRLVRRGQLPAVRVGARLRFRPGDVEAYLAERDAGGPPAPSPAPPRNDSSGTLQRLAFLSSASTQLAATLDPVVTLETLAHLVVPQFADYCTVSKITEGGQLVLVAVAHIDPARAALINTMAERSRAAGRPASKIQQLVLAGEPLLVPEVQPELLDSLASDAEQREMLAALATVSTVLVPLRARNRLLGTLTWSMAESGRRYGPDDLALAEELARRAALALDSAHLYAAAQAAQRRAEHLQELTAALAATRTPQAIAEVVVRQGIAAIGACAGTVVLRRPDSEWLDVLTAQGYDVQHWSGWPLLALTARTPVSDATRTGQAIWLTNREDYAAHYPHQSDPLNTSSSAMAAIPLLLNGHALGALGLSFATPQVFSAEDQALALAMARQCAQALERALLYEREQRALAEAEAARTRVAFLAEASVALAASLDYAVTLQQVVTLAVEHLADWSSLYLLDQQGSGRWVATQARSAEQEALLLELQARYWPEQQANSAPAQVLRSGISALVPQIDLDLMAADIDHEQLRLMRQLDTRSYMVVALRLHDRLLGALSLGRVGDAVPYNSSDLALAEELARRAAVAIENARLYAAEQHAREAAQEAVRQRDAFVSIAAHELRTPLTVLLGNVQLFKRRARRDQVLSERDWRLLSVIESQALRLNSLIMAMLDMSRLRTGRLSIEHAPVDLVALVGRVVDESQPTIGQQHTLVFDAPLAPLEVVGDALRLEQVVLNLLHNAIKYSQPGSAIELRLSRQDGHAQLTVADQGVGIPAAALPRVFEQFYRVTNADSLQINGMGVGLYVVREIVALHNGSVSVESTEGQGSTFTVRLPHEPRQA